MHAENDAREGDAEREENERQFERRIKISEHKRDRRCGHGVTGRKRKLVWGKDFRPAVRFKLAGTRTVAEPLQRFEDEDADDGGKPGGANGGKTMRTAEEKKKDSRGIPDPTVAKTRGRKHPKADPPRGAPAVQAPHQAMIAALNETPDITGNGHFKTPVKNNRPQKICRQAGKQNQARRKVASKSQSRRGAESAAFTSFDHFLQKRISFVQWPTVIAGNKTARGSSARAQGFSQSIAPVTRKTSAVILARLP